jgi:hypothetical protein
MPRNNADFQQGHLKAKHAEYDPETMGAPGKLTPESLTPGDSEAPDWDTHYNKSFRWGHIPRENFLGTDEEYKKGPHIGLVANFGPDFHDWKDAHDTPEVQEWKTNWKEKWKTIPAYKQNQILAAVKVTTHA